MSSYSEICLPTSLSKKSLYYSTIAFFVLMLAHLQTAFSQSTTWNQWEVDIPTNVQRTSVRVDSTDAIRPIWCGSNIIVFPNAVATERQASNHEEFKYLLISQNKFETRKVVGPWNLVGCSPDGERQLRIKDASENGGEYFGSYYLVVADKKIEKIADGVRLVSSDAWQRTFVFSKGVGSWYESSFPGRLKSLPNLEIIKVKSQDGTDGASLNGEMKLIEHDDSEVVLTAKISLDGEKLVRLISSSRDPRLWNDIDYMDLALSFTDGRSGMRGPLRALITGADAIDDVFFDQNKIVISGKTSANNLVIATCDIVGNQALNCISSFAKLSALEFGIIGFDGPSVVIATREIPRYYVDRSFPKAPELVARPCVIEAVPTKLNVLPGRCRTRGSAAPVASGNSYTAFYSLAPGGRHIAVRTKYRFPNDRKWSVVPTSTFSIDQ
ncbi:MAG: hypothetical protein JSR90_06845 [Proteobacteria bacterium]|nr:hypothetical protein [Pseudomonadota bacterium]